MPQGGGEDAERIFSQFQLSDAQKNDLERALEEFDKHFIPKRNVILERATFHNKRSQRDGETTGAH